MHHHKRPLQDALSRHLTPEKCLSIEKKKKSFFIRIVYNVYSVCIMSLFMSEILELKAHVIRLLICFFFFLSFSPIVYHVRTVV